MKQRDLEWRAKLEKRDTTSSISCTEIIPKRRNRCRQAL